VIKLFGGGDHPVERVFRSCSGHRCRGDRAPSFSVGEHFRDLFGEADRIGDRDQQVRVSEEGLQLAERELAQAQRRYQGGVTSNIEVVDAQTRTERARDNRIMALFQYNQARIDLATAMGAIHRILQ